MRNASRFEDGFGVERPPSEPGTKRQIFTTRQLLESRLGIVAALDGEHNILVGAGGSVYPVVLRDVAVVASAIRRKTTAAAAASRCCRNRLVTALR